MMAVRRQRTEEHLESERRQPRKLPTNSKVELRNFRNLILITKE